MSLEVFKEKGRITLFRRLISFLGKKMPVFAVTSGLMESKTRSVFSMLAAEENQTLKR